MVGIEKSEIQVNVCVTVLNCMDGMDESEIQACFFLFIFIISDSSLLLSQRFRVYVCKFFLSLYDFFFFC